MLTTIGPARLWAELDAATRLAAAAALYDGDYEDPQGRAEADVTLAQALRFRLPSLRRMPAAKRAERLSKLGKIEDSLASSLLIGLHLGRRRPMLAAFLDALEMPHDNGILDSEAMPPPPVRERATAAVGRVLESYPRDEVVVYLRTLLALDADQWGVLADIEIGGTE